MAPGYPGEMCEGCWVVVRRETERVFTHLASPTTNPGRRPSSDLTAPPCSVTIVNSQGKMDMNNKVQNYGQLIYCTPQEVLCEVKCS